MKTKNVPLFPTSDLLDSGANGSSVRIRQFLFPVSRGFVRWYFTLEMGKEEKVGLVKRAQLLVQLDASQAAYLVRGIYFEEKKHL